MPTYQYDWFSPIIPTVERAVSRFKGQRVHALEIGSFEGRSTLWFLENVLTHDDATIVCVDHFLGGSDHVTLDLRGLHQRFQENTSGYWHKITVMPLNSWEALRTLASESFDFVFVDGSHESEDVLHDAVEAFRVVKRGGVIVFDDYGWGLDRESRPQVGIDAFLGAFGKRVHVDEKGYAVTVHKL